MCGRRPVYRDRAARQSPRSVDAFQEFRPSASTESEHSGDPSCFYFQVNAPDDPVPGADSVDFQRSFSQCSHSPISNLFFRFSNVLRITPICISTFSAISFSRSHGLPCVLFCRILFFCVLTICCTVNTVRGLISAHQPHQFFPARLLRLHRGYQHPVPQDCHPVSQLHDLLQPVRHVKGRGSFRL